MYSPSSLVPRGQFSERELLDASVDEAVVRQLLAGTLSNYSSIRDPAQQDIIRLERQTGFCSLLLVRSLVDDAHFISAMSRSNLVTFGVIHKVTLHSPTNTHHCSFTSHHLYLSAMPHGITVDKSTNNSSSL